MIATLPERQSLAHGLEKPVHSFVDVLEHCIRYLIWPKVGYLPSSKELTAGERLHVKLFLTSWAS